MKFLLVVSFELLFVSLVWLKSCNLSISSSSVSINMLISVVCELLTSIFQIICVTNSDGFAPICL